MKVTLERHSRVVLDVDPVMDMEADHLQAYREHLGRRETTKARQVLEEAAMEIALSLGSDLEWEEDEWDVTSMPEPLAEG